MTSEGKSDRLVAAWEARDVTTFDEWVIELSDAFNDLNIGLKLSARIIGARSEELQAALNLSALDDAQLREIGELNPPKTTWFRLSSSDEDEFRVILNTLRKISNNESPSVAVEEAIRSFRGPTAEERVASLSSDIYGHALKKAQQFGLLTEKDRNLLKSLKRSIGTGKSITPAQASYAREVFQKLVDGKAITRDSKDNDKEICDEILDALRMA